MPRMTYTEAKAAITELRELPDPAREALRAGGDWRRTDHDATMGNEFADWCDDCKTYHSTSYVATLEVREGVVWDVVLECDMDGNWDEQEAAPSGTPEARTMLEQYTYEAARPGWKDYWLYVLRTGEHPLGLMYRPRDIRWTARDVLFREFGLTADDLPLPEEEDETAV